MGSYLLDFHWTRFTELIIGTLKGIPQYRFLMKNTPYAFQRTDFSFTPIIILRTDFIILFINFGSFELYF